MITFNNPDLSTHDVHMPGDRERLITTLLDLTQGLGYTANLTTGLWLQAATRKMRPGIALRIGGHNPASIRFDDFYRFVSADMGKRNPLPGSLVDSPIISDPDDLIAYLTALRAHATAQGRDPESVARALDYYNWSTNWTNLNTGATRERPRYDFDDCLYLARFRSVPQFFEHVVSRKRLSMSKVKKRYSTLLDLIEQGMQPSLILPLYPELRRR